MENKYLDELKRLNEELGNWSEEDWDRFLADAKADLEDDQYAELENFILGD